MYVKQCFVYTQTLILLCEIFFVLLRLIILSCIRSGNISP